MLVHVNIHVNMGDVYVQYDVYGAPGKGNNTIIVSIP
jgi:hypothetical protein